MEAKSYNGKKVEKLLRLGIGREVCVRTPPILSKEADKGKRHSVIDIHDLRFYDVSIERGIVRRNRSQFRDATTVCDFKTKDEWEKGMVEGIEDKEAQEVEIDPVQNSYKESLRYEVISQKSELPVSDPQVTRSV